MRSQPYPGYRCDGVHAASGEGEEERELQELREALRREREHRLEAERRVEQLRQLPRVRRLLKAINWTRLNRWSMSPGPPPAVAPPLFFIVGRGKSGTSWLMETLDRHPEILCRGEGQFFGTGDEEPAPWARSLQRALLSSPELREWWHHGAWVRGDKYERGVGSIAGAAAARIMGERLVASDARIAGDKTPLNGTDVVAQIAAGVPGAKVIHMIRDGRDAAVSAVHHIWNNRERITGAELDPDLAARRDRYRSDPSGFGPGGESLFARGHLAGTAARWRAYTARARADGRALLGERYAEVRYEDMLSGPEAELIRLLGFLGVEAGGERAAACLEGASFERGSGGRRPGEEDSASFRRKGVAGDWRRVFTEEDKATFKREAGPLLVELGYERDEDW